MTELYKNVDLKVAVSLRIIESSFLSVRSTIVIMVLIFST